MQALNFLSQLSRRQLTIALDDPGLAPLLESLGFSTVPFEACDFAVDSAESVLTLLTHLRSCEVLRGLWNVAPGPVCHLSFAKFDPSTDAIKESLERLLGFDFPAILEQRRRRYEELFSASCLSVRSAAGLLRCITTEELEVPNPGDSLDPGYLYSLAEFLECSVVNLAGPTSSFSADGELAVDGLIFLCNTETQRQQYFTPLDRLQKAAAQGSNRLTFEKNELVDIVQGGANVTSELRGMTADFERGLMATEFGIGCAPQPTQSQFATNTVLNKSGHGFYIGIGQGWKLPHIDFISSGADCSFQASPFQ